MTNMPSVIVGVFDPEPASDLFWAPTTAQVLYHIRIHLRVPEGIFGLSGMLLSHLGFGSGMQRFIDAWLITIPLNLMGYRGGVFA
ncbi:MAG: hypothetical protein A2785_01945 [Candidatus Chisholmbacteria bacterium RIFCSPHIGHO2_01_FULL_49_18]|uniref:Uncharacterized protein n=1 Tax=Candidatus Chisholmbacteria bacterium RIFCSPHIGHO2_01_FULL_49_18 TaxID=1797590 RepID=A0A1G1VMS5_9BACT|nr:MAG: hypothetical protein A2785_01945 [Candidatus Chisholmbacteria bacterium RIFCSPHIGHO2_01_FULL_49_18]